MQNAKSEWLSNGSEWVLNLFENTLFYGIFFFIMVVAFTYFYTFIVFHPEKVAENLQKQGGFIPGLRPGTETKKYLYNVMNRITLFGAMFLGLVAVAPFLIPAVIQNPNLVISGSGMLIVVGVVLETNRQIKAHLITRSYEAI